MVGSFSRILLAVAVLLSLCALSAAYTEREGMVEARVPVSVSLPRWVKDYDPISLELDSTIQEETTSAFPTEHHRNIARRMSWGIYRFKTGWSSSQGETFSWYFCGEKYKGEAARQLADTIAYNIVEATHLASRGSKELNPWGVLGTMAKESSFDICAFGLHPRKAAYQMSSSSGKGNVIQPSRITISHTYEEVVRAINDKGMKKSFRAFDLGGLQVLDRYYTGDSADLLTWKGFYWQVGHMQERSITRNCSNPWAYWKGHYSKAYESQVVYYARKMGAFSSEIQMGSSSF